MIRPLLLALLPTTVLAEAPRVAVDIAPIHSITAQLMQGVGTPDLMLPPSADPHDYAFRPSEARRISQANIIITVGPELTPWLVDPLAALAPDATVISLTANEDWARLDMRDGHDHDHGHDHDDDEALDPHAWLDPSVAKAWALEISTQLMTNDLNNSDQYKTNLIQLTQDLDALDAQLSDMLTDIPAFLWPHDGYQYFEVRYDLPAHGSITAGDGETAGPAHMRELIEEMEEHDIKCLFTDVHTSPATISLLTEQADVDVFEISNLGASLDAGPDLYSGLMLDLATALTDCRDAN